MKAKFSLFFALVLVFAASTVFVTHSTAADKTEVTGTEVFDPLGLFGAPVGEILLPGAVTCPSFEPTGDPLQPCPVGARIHIRDYKFVSRVNSTDPALAGWMTVVLNANFDANATGPTWGTFSLALDAGGTWDGTYQGIRFQEGSTWVIPFHVSGQGTGGAIDGMHLLAVDRIVAFAPAPVVYTGSIEGCIIDPHSK